MNQPEISALKTEIALLNEIIAAQQIQINSLHRLVSTLKTSSASGIDFSSTHNFKGGIETNSASNVKIEGGIGTNILSNVKNNLGIETDSAPTHKIEGGIGTSSAQGANSEGGITTNSAALPVTIPLTPANISKVAGVLGGFGFVRVSYDYKISVAKLLLHLYNKMPGDHPTLRHLTSLSKGGLAKCITSIKRRGMINRSGWQAYALTENALLVLRKAGVQ